MSDLSSPTADRKIFVRHTVFFLEGVGGRGGARQGCPNLRYFAFPASTSFSLTSSVPLALFRLPLGGQGEFRDVPTSRTLHSRLAIRFLGILSPTLVPLACDAQTYFRSSLLCDDRKYVCSSQALAGYSPISPVSTAKYLIQ